MDLNEIFSFFENDGHNFRVRALAPQCKVMANALATHSSANDATGEMPFPKATLPRTICPATTSGVEARDLLASPFPQA